MLTPNILLAENTEKLKIAILDNLTSQKLSSTYYENEYLAGIKTAVLAAKNTGINIEYRYFKYEKGPLDILKVIREVEVWDPDYIIGPRFSDKFLLLKPYFNNVMVISPLGSAKIIKKMPENFYSLSMSDNYVANVIEKIISKKLKYKNKIYIFPAKDCKSCYEIAKDIKDDYKNLHPTVDVIENDFFSDNVENINISTLVKGFQRGDIIVVPNISYVSGILIARIVNYLKIPNIIFIGADGWAASKVAYVGKIKTDTNFIAYHLSGWPLIIKSTELIKFKKLYHTIFNHDSIDNISFISYQAAMAGVDSYSKTKEKCPAKEKILHNFKLIRNKYHSKVFAVYKLDTDNEKIVYLYYFKKGFDNEF